MEEVKPKPGDPGSVEHFFNEVLTIIKQNAQGEPRVLILTETTTNQFWINGMIPNVTWLLGMLKRATVSTDASILQEVMTQAEHNRVIMEEMISKATPGGGKPQ